MKINVLITGISSSNSISFVKGLRKQNEIDVNIIGTDIYEEAFSTGAHFVDTFYKVPYANDPEFVSFLLELCRENNVHVVVPIIDEEFILLSQARGDFEQIGAKVMLPDHEQLLVCQDKYETYLFLQSNGFPIPETWVTIPEYPRYPIMLKPRVARGSKGIRIIKDKEELEMNIGTKEHIYQEMINGKELTVDTLSDMNGKVLAVVPRVRLEIRNGVSYKGITINNKAVEEMCIDICETLGLKGPACLQCKLTDEDVPYFFDFNPRIGSAVILSIHAGVNIPLLAVKNILGMRVDSMRGKFQENTVMLRYWNEVFSVNH